MLHIHLASLPIRFHPVIVGGIVLEIVIFLLVQRRPYLWTETLLSIGIFILHLPEHLLRLLFIAPPFSCGRIG
ncbi:MAG TPA: hypothetical protein VGC09_03935 [Rhodopila sp.]